MYGCNQPKSSTTFSRLCDDAGNSKNTNSQDQVGNNNTINPGSLNYEHDETANISTLSHQRDDVENINNSKSLDQLENTKPTDPCSTNHEREQVVNIRTIKRTHQLNQTSSVNATITSNRFKRYITAHSKFGKNTDFNQIILPKKLKKTLVLSWIHQKAF